MGTNVATSSAVSAETMTSDLGREGSGAAKANEDDEREREEIYSVITTSLAAVATAWAAFQSATWSGRQTFALVSAMKLRQRSTEARLEGDQQAHLDANLFVAWTSAYLDDNEPLTQFLYDRFPPRLKTAMDAWLATKPHISKDAPLHPLAMPEYRLEAHERAVTLDHASDDALQEGRDSNRTSDTYVLGTVLFAMVILLASLGPRLRRRNPRRVMLTLSAVAFVVAIAWLARMPIAWVGV